MLADQAAECRQLRLLHALGELAGIGEESDQRGGPVAAQRREMRFDLAAAIGRDEGCPLARVACGAPAPAFDVIQQPRRDLAQQPTGLCFGPEQLARGFVDQPDAVLGVDDDDALAQVLDDVFGQLGQVRDVDLQRSRMTSSVSRSRRVMNAPPAATSSSTAP